MIGTGFARDSDTWAAADVAVRVALAQLDGEVPVWALAFATGRHDPKVLMRALRARLDNIPVVGGAAFGVYVAGGFGYGGHECAVAVFGAAEPSPTILSETFAGDAKAAGYRLGERLTAASRPGDSVLLFYDFVRQARPFKNYASSHLLDGLYQSLDQQRLFITGGATLGDFRFSNSFTFAGDRVLHGGVVAAVFPGGRWQPEHAISHGCSPLSTYLELTRVEGHTVWEIDGRPALDVLVEVANIDPSVPLGSVMDLWLTLGVNYGDLYGEFDESDYVNYFVRDTDPQTRSFSLTELSPEEGTHVQIMGRDHQSMLRTVQSRAEAFCASLSGSPAFTLITNGAGRFTPFAGSRDAEGLMHVETLPEGPYLGFLCGCELAPFDGVTRSMNWTEVLTSFVPTK